MSKKNILDKYAFNFSNLVIKSKSNKQIPLIEMKNTSMLMSRTRKDDLSDSLSMQVQDPLWMLARQWQLGEFRGNNAGTAVGVSCKIRKHNLDTNEINTPLEYVVERVEPEITPRIRIEAALYYLQRFSERKGEDSANELSQLQAKYPLDNEYIKCGVDSSQVKGYAEKTNKRLNLFMKTFAPKSFDGYKLYNDLLLNKKSSEGEEYCKWFSNRYLSNNANANNWDTQSLSYKGSTISYDERKLRANDYSGGRLSWYSFDSIKDDNQLKSEKLNNGEEITLHALPTLSTYAGAPAKRLWQFENYKVYMGNSSDLVQTQANILMMQYATMYSNDWMLIPFQTELSSYIQVEELQAWDTFGLRYKAKSVNGIWDNFNSSKRTYDQRWRMFNIAPENYSQIKNSYNEMPGLLMPPCFVDSLESNPIEEVDFLRDEMANMIWGVEMVVSDGTGTPLDASAYANDICRQIEEQQDETLAMLNENSKLILSKDSENNTHIDSSRKSDFSYLIQNTVPFNWIPFVPQQISERENVLRRGKMPCFLINTGSSLKSNKHYLPVRPISSLLHCKINDNGKEIPLFINEEEILQTGLKIVKNYQHARWFNGKPYHWLGICKQLKKMSEGSNLKFDKLI